MAKQQNKNQGESGSTSPIDVQRYLKGVDYPTGKQTLVDCAMEEGAGEDVIEALEQLPDKDFNSPADVMRAFGQTSSSQARQRSAS